MRLAWCVTICWSYRTVCIHMSHAQCDFIEFRFSRFSKRNHYKLKNWNDGDQSILDVYVLCSESLGVNIFYPFDWWLLLIISFVDYIIISKFYIIICYRRAYSWCENKMIGFANIRVGRRKSKTWRLYSNSSQSRIGVNKPFEFCSFLCTSVQTLNHILSERMLSDSVAHCFCHALIVWYTILYVKWNRNEFVLERVEMNIVEILLLELSSDSYAWVE